MDSLYTKYKNKCGIYCIQNIINNTLYIGSSVNIGRRLANHLRWLKQGIHFNPYLQHSWNKNEEANFKFYVLEECKKEELAEREEYYIKINKNTYNVDKEIIRHSHPREIVELIAAKNRGQKRTEETRSKLSKIAKQRARNPMQGVHRYGKEAPMYGKSHSDKTKNKISATKIAQSKARKVIAITENSCTEYISVILASRILNIPQQNIYECLKGKRKTAKGFKFKYKDMEEKKEVEKEVKGNSEKKLSYSELENIAHQLSEQSRQLYAKLQEANMANIFKRLDYLFKVVENACSFNEEFITKCVAEIEELMTVPEEEDSNKEKTSNIKIKE